MQEAAKAIDAAAAEAASPPPRMPGVTQVEVRQPTRTSDWLWSGGAGALTLAGQTLTVLFLTIFLLSEGDSFKRKFVRHMQTRGSQRVTVTILNDIEQQIGRFIAVTTATSMVVGVATALALWSIEVRHAGGMGPVCRRDERGALFRAARRDRGPLGRRACCSSATSVAPCSSGP